MIWIALFLQAQADELPAKLRELNPVVIPADTDEGKRMGRMLYDDERARIRTVNERETAAWRAIRTREEWEKYRDAKIGALRESLGFPGQPPAEPRVRVTKTVEGEGYRIENVVFGDQPLVTANLYSASRPPASMPGILIVHSHHNPKTQGELQDMGVLWAKAGCAVLVMDQIGHGERRQHPFKDAASFPGPFKVGRQDYWFRYNTSLQLYLAGQSLVGRMAWDLMRGVDLLLARPGVDKERIILLGSVAGGGDPAGITAALDPRITCVVPFNFGGPQPETTYPLPEDAESAFNYAGSGGWESTRNIAFSVRDGFLPWVIVGSVAPRYLIHAHEFEWDRERDPVWKRYQKIWDFYGQTDRVASTKGRGSVRGQAPESTHCNNIGAVHRQAGIYQAFERWFKIPAPEKENTERKTAEELACLTPELRPVPLHEVIAASANARPGTRGDLRKDWARVLGDVEPSADFKMERRGNDSLGAAAAQRLTLHAEAITVPMILLVPSKGDKFPVVVAFGQEGKAGFLKHRTKEIAELLAGGAAVCLVDLRGTGESRPGNGVDRTSGLTAASASELMLGRTLPGLRVKDLRTALRYLRARPDLDGSRVALWGDSFAPVNAADARLEVPWDAPKLPEFAHPAGPMAALFGMLFEDGVKGAYARGGLESFASALKSSFVYLPHDSFVPGALTAGDLPEVAAAVASRGWRHDHAVDGLNRRVGAAPDESPAAWLLSRLSR